MGSYQKPFASKAGMAGWLVCRPSGPNALRPLPGNTFTLMVWRKCAQCSAICRNGKRCSITSASLLLDDAGRSVGEPLRMGSDRCRVHLDFFRLTPVVCDIAETTSILVFYDLETTGHACKH